MKKEELVAQIESMDVDRDDVNKDIRVALKGLEIPYWFMTFLVQIFSGLPKDAAKVFPLDFASAFNQGQDLDELRDLLLDMVSENNNDPTCVDELEYARRAGDAEIPADASYTDEAKYELYRAELLALLVS